jgi:N-acetylneuraminate synthase
MSEETQIIDACEIIDPDVIMHTLSTYPSPIDELNLNYINRLKILFPKKQIGYSGHEFGLVTTISTVVLGVSWIERHITLDRNMWGSDQLSSIEPSGLFKLVKGIRILEASLGSDDPRKISPSENVKLESLRG